MNRHTIFSHSKLIITCGLLMVFVMGCTDGFDVYNTNQHEATEDMMTWDNLKTGAFFSQLQRNVVLFNDGTNDDGSYQISQGLTADLYSGYIAPTGSWYGGVHNGTYSFITNWIEKTFTSGFASVMPAWQSIVEIAEEQGNDEVIALATVVKVEAMHRVADAYGPIPYCNYGSGSLQNDYDSLEDVYKKFFEELDTSIDVLTAFVQANPTSTLLEKYDLVYSGNVTNWVKFANTLRLRLALRVYYADATLAETQARKSLENPIGFVSAKSERPSLKHSSNLVYHHPLHEIAYNFNEGEARMSASMDAYMNGYNDPRLAAYFVPAVADGNYHGVRLGIEATVWSKYVGENISNLNMDESTTEIVWMTAAESYFLRAEAALRGWLADGMAQQMYEQGISVSFEENGVSGATAYIADDTSTPTRFVDNAESSNYGTSSAPSSIKIAWNESAREAEKLERIITQKWIAMYPDGPEGWAEFRRTGYPKLIPVVSNLSNGAINTNTQVRRIPYPQSEYNNNLQGVNIGVQKLGGQDNGGTRLWWDKE